MSFHIFCIIRRPRSNSISLSFPVMIFSSIQSQHNHKFNSLRNGTMSYDKFYWKSNNFYCYVIVMRRLMIRLSIHLFTYFMESFSLCSYLNWNHIIAVGSMFQLDLCWWYANLHRVKIENWSLEIIYWVSFLSCDFLFDYESSEWLGD